MIFTSPPISRSAIFQKTLLAACLSVVYTSCVLAQTHTDLKQTDLNATGFKPDVNDVKSIGPKAIYGDVFTTNRVDSRKSKALTANAPYNPITNNDDQSQIPEIEMFVGESRVFPAPGVARIAVGNGALLTAAALESKEVLVFANAPGTSSLFVWNESGNYQRVKINIVAGETNRVSREIAVFLNTIPNTKSSIVGDKVVVEGDNLSDVDVAKIETLTKRYPQIVNFTNTMGWEQMVMVDVKVVEFPVTELRELGMKWGTQGGAALGGIWTPGGRGDGGYALSIPNAAVGAAGGAAGSVFVPPGLNLLSAINLGLNAQINLLAQNGKAALLAEPQLSTRNGAKASFLAGGEYPYLVSTSSGPTVQFKPYGIKLDIEPKVDKTGAIRAVIDTEVSSIDPAISTSAGPGLLSRKTKAEFNVKSGETIVLAGLIQRETSSSLDKVPGLGDIPIIGALFRSKRYQNKETELVIFVTPTIVSSTSPGLVDKVNRTGERLEQIMGSKPYLSNPLQPQTDTAKVLVAPTHLPPVFDPIVADKVPPSQSLVDTDKKPVFKSDEGSTLQVLVDGLVIREAPNSKSNALFILGRGSVVRMGSLPEKMLGSTVWRNVILGEINGWVIAQWVEHSTLVPQYKPANAIASTPSQLAKVDINGEQLITATGTLDSAKNRYKPRRYRVNLDQLALRLTPNVNAPIVQNLSLNTLLTTTTPPKGNWLQVEIVDSSTPRQGWVAAQWIVPINE